MNYIAEYNAKIQSGEIAASKRVKAVYARLAAGTKQIRGGYIFDEARANRPIEFIERFCKHSKGEWAGQGTRIDTFEGYKQDLTLYCNRRARQA